MYPEISFIIFGKDVGIDIYRTIKTVSEAMNGLPHIIYEVLVVDDGSEISIDQQKIFSEFSNIKHVLILDKSIGVSGAIFSVINNCRFKNVLPIPGHDMFSKEAIENVAKLVGYGDIVIGCRSNLSTQRPPIKKLASRILRDIYRHLTFYYVGDIHGLIMYKKTDLIKFLKLDGRHANAISVVTPVLANGGLLVQTIAPIKEGHDKRPSRKARDSFPNPRNVLVVIYELRMARNIYLNRIQ